jgi:hypothetical protein
MPTTLLAPRPQSEVETLWAFQRATAARSVKFAAWPTNVGYTPAPDTECTSADVPMRFTAAAPLGISGIKSSAVMGSLGLYRCAALAIEHRGQQSAVRA